MAWKNIIEMQQLKYDISYFMVTWKILKPDFMCVCHKQFYIKGCLFPKKRKKKKGQVFKIINVPWLVSSSQSRSTGRGKCTSVIHRKDMKHDAYTTNLFLFWIFSSQHSTLVKSLRARVHSRCIKVGNLSSKCCQTWQDAEEWCICLMYLQRNENTITPSFLWALPSSQLLPGLLVLTSVMMFPPPPVQKVNGVFVQMYAEFCGCGYFWPSEIVMLTQTTHWTTMLV